MANNPKKVKDPTEVALSAIQEALNISDPATDGNRSSSRGETPPPIMPAETPSFNESSFDTRQSADRPMFLDDQRPARRPANDDRETIGQLLQAIQQGRPARSVYTIASLFTVVWLVGCGILTISFLSALQATVGQGGGVLGCGLAALKGKFRLRFVGEGLSATRTIGLKALVQFSAPFLLARRTQSKIALRGGRRFRLGRDFRMITKMTGALSRGEHRATLRAYCIHR